MENKKLDEKRVDYIPKDAVVNISVNGEFYHSLKIAIVEHLNEDETKESIAKILSHIENNEVHSPKERRLHLLMTTLGMIERQAIKDGVSVNCSVKEYQDKSNSESQQD